jgi:hypothetical protein
MTTLRTEDLDQGDQYLHTVTEQISTAIVDDPTVQDPEATQASTSGNGTGLSPPPPSWIGPASSSLEWSGIESDEEDTSTFAVEPSKVVSTSPPEPTPPPQQD